jgi:hypothetical protein
MKTVCLSLALGLAVAGVGLNNAVAFGTGDNALRLTVTFVDPQKFTDASDSSNSISAREDTLAQLKTYLIQRAGVYLGAGQKLTITVTDVDLAGAFEPWRTPPLADVRIVREIYPPRINLILRLTDEDGRVVKEGKRELRDLSFMTKLVVDRNDPFHYEKNLIDEWLSEEFRTVKKAD